ncbi:MAG TPA: dienelactone hydrolase family protein [Tepidisphaeraceae bacterium]|nr:dienelactone hydrolase family protein [Tepidisphaeraceae bacterium]
MRLSLAIIALCAILPFTLPPVAAQDSAKSATAPVPPGGENATKALTDSPRHGEWQDVAVPGRDAKIRTWVSYPERKDGAPVVIVIHEIFGLTDWVRSVADQLAAEGFVAVAPDLLSGKGPGGGGTESFEGDQVRAAIRGLSATEVDAGLNAVRDWAVALPSTTDQTATIGFCWGGSASIAYASREPELDAAVVYYGTGPRDVGDFKNLQAPVLGLYGGDDARVTSTVEGTATAMKEAGKFFTQHVYDGAGHGFLRQQSAREGKNQRAAEAAWQETITFLKQHLEPRN